MSDVPRIRFGQSNATEDLCARRGSIRKRFWAAWNEVCDVVFCGKNNGALFLVLLVCLLLIWLLAKLLGDGGFEIIANPNNPTGSKRGDQIHKYMLRVGDCYNKCKGSYMMEGKESRHGMLFVYEVCLNAAQEDTEGLYLCNEAMDYILQLSKNMEIGQARAKDRNTQLLLLAANLLLLPNKELEALREKVRASQYLQDSDVIRFIDLGGTHLYGAAMAKVFFQLRVKHLSDNHPSFFPSSALSEKLRAILPEVAAGALYNGGKIVSCDLKHLQSRLDPASVGRWSAAMQEMYDHWQRLAWTVDLAEEDLLIFEDERIVALIKNSAAW